MNLCYTQMSVTIFFWRPTISWIISYGNFYLSFLVWFPVCLFGLSVCLICQLLCVYGQFVLAFISGGEGVVISSNLERKLNSWYLYVLVTQTTSRTCDGKNKFQICDSDTFKWSENRFYSIHAHLLLSNHVI